MPLTVCPICERVVPDAAVGCLECREAPEASPDQPVNEPDAASVGSVGRREVLLVAAALVASGAITLTLLSARGKVPVDVPVPRAVTASGFAGPSVEAGPRPHGATWTDNSDAWVGGDRHGIALELAARNETPVWMRRVRPLLIVRCANRRTDVFVFTDSAAAMEQQDEDHAVKVTLDDEPDRTERWPDSASHDALFAPDGAAFVRQLGRARTLRFAYTPHNAAPVVAQFNVVGLSEHLTPADARCTAGR
ncbi:MAG: hypothetical protein H0W08_18615 [Acidobacteria bacterium]|nr:hypothetical protein [Acidobacteriota bacterium]